MCGWNSVAGAQRALTIYHYHKVKPECFGKQVVSLHKLQIHSVISKVCQASYALYFVGIKTSNIWKAFAVPRDTFAGFSYYKVQGDPGSEHNRAPLHRATRTSDKAPAILEYSMKQLQTSPHTLSNVETHLSHYAFRKAIKHLTYLLRRPTLTRL